MVFIKATITITYANIAEMKSKITYELGVGDINNKNCTGQRGQPY